MNTKNILVSLTEVCKHEFVWCLYDDITLRIYNRSIISYSGRIVMCLNETRKRPGTLIKYLHSMKKFGLFLTLYHDQASALGLPQARLHKTILMLTDFIRSTRPRINARQAELKSQISGMYMYFTRLTKMLLFGVFICALSHVCEHTVLPNRAKM